MCLFEYACGVSLHIRVYFFTNVSFHRKLPWFQSWYLSTNSPIHLGLYGSLVNKSCVENGCGVSQGTHLGIMTIAHKKQLAVVSRHSAEGSLKILFFCIERLNIPLKQNNPMLCVLDQGVFGLHLKKKRKKLNDCWREKGQNDQKENSTRGFLW